MGSHQLFRLGHGFNSYVSHYQRVASNWSRSPFMADACGRRAGRAAGFVDDIWLHQGRRIWGAAGHDLWDQVLEESSTGFDEVMAGRNHQKRLGFWYGALTCSKNGLLACLDISSILFCNILGMFQMENNGTSSANRWLITNYTLLWGNSAQNSINMVNAYHRHRTHRI